MIADSMLRLPRPTRAGSFAALMSLYESNYVRLGWLVSDLSGLDNAMVSTPADDLPLYLDLLDESRYTTTVRLTYMFDEQGQAVPDPDLRVRLYHDARMAEAMDCTRHHLHAALRRFDSEPATELSRRWTRNVMLNKWLEYCADKGHVFRMATHAVAQPSIS